MCDGDGNWYEFAVPKQSAYKLVCVCVSVCACMCTCIRTQACLYQIHDTWPNSLDIV